MEIFEALRTRRAVRDFTAEPVSPAVIDWLIEAAIWAPSAMNRQPWGFAIIEGAERLDGYSERAKRHFITLMADDPSLEPFRPRVEDPALRLFYGGPMLVVVCAIACERQASEDCCLAAQNLMLAAHAAHLGSCWIGLARPWLTLPEVKAELGLPGGWMPVAPIILGHPAAATPPPPSRERPRIVHCR